MKNLLDNTGLSPYQIILTQVYIISCGFPHLIKLPVTVYKLQISEFIFLLLFISVLLSGQIKETLTKLKLKSSPLFFSIGLFGCSLTFAVLCNFSRVSFLELSGFIYLTCVFFTLLAVFSRISDLYVFLTDSLEKFGFTLCLIGIGGWLLHLAGVENPTGLIREYPYFGEVFRLQGFTPTPAYFINIVGFILLSLLALESHIKEKKRKISLAVLLSISILLTLSKSILLILICVILYFINRKNISGFLKYFLHLTSVGVLIFFLTATHFLFVNCNEIQEQSTLQDDTYVSSVPICQKDNFCILETNYLLYKRSALIAGWRYPLSGLGPGQHTRFLEKLATEPTYAEKYKGQKGDTHCTYTGMFAEAGILGGLSVILFFFFLMRTSLQLSFGLFIVSLFFALEAINTDLMNFRHLWVFTAFIVAFQLREKGLFLKYPN